MPRSLAFVIMLVIIGCFVTLAALAQEGCG